MKALSASDWAVLLGVALVTVGAWRIYAPLVWLVPGIAAVGWGILRERTIK